jgi:hypothetical protein
MNAFLRPLFCLALIALTGCAVGNTHQYAQRGLTLPVQAATVSSIAVGVQDQRPYVVNGRKAGTFVGLQRAGFGNPWDINTASGQPLADDIRGTITTALERNGAQVIPVTLPINLDTNSASQRVLSYGSNRSVMVGIKEWKSDTYSRTGLEFDMHVAVRDREGRLLGENRIRGAETLGGAAILPVSAARAEVEAAYPQKIIELFNNPSISSALR